MQFFEALAKKHGDLKIHKSIPLNNAQNLKFDGAFTVIHLNADLNPCIYLMAETQQILDDLRVEHNDSMLSICSSKKITYNSYRKPMGFFKKLKFLFSNDMEITNQQHTSLIIFVCSSVLPDIEVVRSCLFKAKDIKQDSLNVKLKGSGSLKLKGKVINLTAALDGSGYIDAKNLFTQNISAILDGSGMLSGHANHSAELRLSGSGLINISGKPIVNSYQKHGSGMISCH